MSKSPFVKYTPEQIVEAESNSYMILLGSDLFSYNGKYTFTKDKAEHYMEQIEGGLLEMLETGNEEEKEEAIMCLFLLKILPFRLH